MDIYEDIRPKIENGDVVFTRSSITIVRRLICWATGGPYNHVLIAFWIGSGKRKRLLGVESSSGGRRVVTMSAYQGDDFDVVVAPVPWPTIEDDALERTGIENYGYRDLLRIAVQERFGWNFGDPKGEVCSEFVAKIHNKFGLTLPTTPSPNKLFQAYKDMGLALRCQYRRDP